jgi:3-methyladenine DNA glycosylase AlkD
MTDTGGTGERTAADVTSALVALASPERAASAARFFKTGPGQYGEGDMFLGVSVPATREVVRRFADLSLHEVARLLGSGVHEHRLAGLLLLVRQYEVASSARQRDDAARGRLSDFYLAAVHAGRVNNWDLVDSSAPALLGDYLFDRPRGVLAELAASSILWERRVGIIATLGLIMRGDASTTLELSATLLNDREDLMHKAVGWMLREVGKRVDRELLTGFLDKYATRMSRAALSYATEHLDPVLRAHYRAR